MSSNTPNLDLHMKNPLTDGNDTFNIETMLNENWRKIDEKVPTKTEMAAAIKVQSVNGKTGTVQLTASDVGADTPTAVQQKIDLAIAGLINGAPGALDTLKELADAFGNDANFATTILNRLTTNEQDSATHKADTMPHQFTASDSKKYRYGFKTNTAIDGLIFVYEEVL